MNTDGHIFKQVKRNMTVLFKNASNLGRDITDLLGTTEETSTAGSNETDLLTSGGESGDSGSVTNVLMVTTTMRMVDGVHGDTTSDGPAVTLSLVLVVGTTGLQEGLVHTTTTSDDTDGSTGIRRDDLLGTRGKLDTSGAIIYVMTDDGGVVARGTGKSTAITSLLFNVADDGTLGHGGEGEDVTNGQGGLLTTVDKLASVHALSGDESGSALLVSILITELDLGEGSTTTGIVDDLTDDSTDVTVTLGKVESTELGGTLTVLGVSLEDASMALALSTNNTTHLHGER
jgi:hypothetical protein